MPGFKYLNTADLIVIVVYFCCLVGLGFYLKKRAAASIEDYFLGGKKLPWWALGISGMASFLDITGTVVITSFLFILGPRGLYIAFRGGAVLVLAFMLIWAGKWHRRSNVITGAEWQVYRFGKRVGGHVARLVAAISGIIFTIAMLTYMITGVGPFLAMYLPFSPMTCAVILLSVATVYTMVSGFYGVVFTDIFQSVIILTAVIGISVLAVQKVSGYDGSFTELASDVTHTESWTSSLPAMDVSMPEGYEAYTALATLAFFYLIKNVLAGIGGGGDPKYFGARNERECGLLTFLWTWLMMFRWPMMMGFAILGVFLVKDRFPDQTVLKDSEIAIKQYVVGQEQPAGDFDVATIARLGSVVSRNKWSAVLESPQQHPELAAELERALGAEWQARLNALNEQKKQIERIIPKTRWGKQLSVVSNSPEDAPELAAELQRILGDEWQSKIKMVSYEGWVNPEQILPSVLLFSIPQGFRGLLLIALLAASMSTFDSTVNMTTGLFTRDVYQAYVRPRASNRELIYASYVFGVVLVVCAFAFASTIKNITDIWDWIIMGLTSGIAVPSVIRLYWWRFNASGVIVATITGLVAAILQRVFLPGLGPVEQFLLVTTVSVIGAVVGTYLAPPTEKRVLEHFYKTTRPFGFWGPLKGILNPRTREIMTREHRNDLIAIPFVLCWQITLFFLPMLALVQNWQAFGAVLVIFVVCLFGMYKFWYKNLPPAREGVATEEEIDAGQL